ncbi:hypothetical protein DL98DRAFT_656798 [Cadophora sp. DSE1049]|nr:hypothetical protein DL98DRAFT_656798 [Cadophora sp. DSE1049]
MSKAIASLPSGPTKWKGVRFLGDGASAMAGLWEGQGRPDVPALPFKQVVIMEVLKISRSLEYERDFLISCNRSNSTHLLKMLQDSDVVSRASNEGLGPQWDDVHRRLFLEYCSLGSLEDLLHKRGIETKHFTEKSLWLILNCLVDGLLAMEYGCEFQTNPQNGQSYHPGRREGWNPIIHFDIKPDNVFLANDALHYVTPIFKFADFGLAAYDFLDDPFTDEERESFRRNGTEDYYPPEQFTEQWDFSDYKESEVAGQYSFYTTFGGVGVIMYQLVTLSEDPPDH